MVMRLGVSNIDVISSGFCCRRTFVFPILTATPIAPIFCADSLQILVALVRHHISATLRFVEQHPDKDEEMKGIHIDGLKVYCSIKLSLIQPNTENSGYILMV